jgi:hypothetical protein
MTRTIAFTTQETAYLDQREPGTGKLTVVMEFERGDDLDPFRQAAECNDERTGIATLLECLARRLRGEIDGMPHIEL